MSSPPKNHRKGGPDHKSKRPAGKLPEKSFSFHGKAAMTSSSDALPRPRTLPNLLARKSEEFALQRPPRLTKLLLNVTIQRSLGAVRVVMPPEAAVGELIAAALRQYTKEQRLPVLHSVDASDYDLHYSQFSLESLDRDEKLVALGSRNFFLCPKTKTAESGGLGGALTSRCSKEVETSGKKGSHWLKFMDFLL